MRMDMLFPRRPLLIVTVLFTLVHGSYCLECYACLSITDPHSCNQTARCGQNEVCFTDRRGSASILGCATQEQCNRGSTLVGRDVANRQSSDCHECCSADLCNTHLCAHLEPSACVDDETVDCPKLNTLFGVCAEVHQAKLVCAKFCNLCSLVDGQWSLWSSWSVCSVTCDNGIESRHRTCTNPAPANGGLSCFGPLTETKLCSLQPCPVDGQWSLWSPWSVCSVTCENGTETRHRACTNPAPTNGGLSCFGALTETKLCLLEPCPVHGGWSMWADWGSCSVSCDVGMQFRERSCNNPFPARYGDHCFGNPQEYRICMPRPCANGGWSVWEAWSSCSDSCGGGVKTRERLCNNPPPSLIGRACTGISMQSTTCNRNQCPDIDNCNPNPCKNNGTCTDGVNSFTCACGILFTGTTCQTTFCQDNSILNTSGITNVALRKPVSLSSLYDNTTVGSLMVDGNRTSNDGFVCAHTIVSSSYPWALIDLGQNYTIKFIYILNRSDCCAFRLHNFDIAIGDTMNKLQTVIHYNEVMGSECVFGVPLGTSGRYVMLQIMGRAETLTVCEFEVYA